MGGRERLSGAAAGRGVLFLTVSKGYFIVSGYAVIFGITRILSPELFGVYALVTGIVSVLNAVLITGTIQAVSKFVSEDPRHAGAVRSASLRLQLLVGGGLFLAYFLGAPVIAWFLNDPSLVIPIRVSSLIVIAYAFYAVYMGLVNGMRRFGTQASLDMTFSTLKLLLVLAAAYLGSRYYADGAIGAIAGFGAAAAAVLLIARSVVRTPSAEGWIPLGTIFRFQLFIILFALITNLLLKTDLFLLKRLSPPAGSDLVAAYYAAAQALAFIPYQAIISITFVIFPLISHLTAIEERDRARDYIREALRYSLLITLAIAAIFSSSADAAVRLLFPAGYEAAGGALSILVFGVVAFSLFFVSATVVSGSGRPAHSTLLGLGTLALDVALNYALIPSRGMRGAAIATTCAMTAGLAASWTYLRVRFGACLPFMTVLRGAAAAGAVFLAARFIPGAGILLIGKFAVLGGIYLAVLLILRELGPNDLARVKRVLGTP